MRNNGEPVVLVLVTDRLDLDADLVALGYRYRWSVELYFRWFKCILGCRHLLLTSPDGVALQVYAALIASLLIRLWIGCKPNKATYEMLCHYFSGWASEAELNTYLERQARRLNSQTDGPGKTRQLSNTSGLADDGCVALDAARR